MSDEKKVLFVVNGQKVDGLGRVDGKPAEKPASPSEVETLRGQLQTAQARITELEGQLAAQAEAGSPDSTDTRNVAELKAALDAKGVQYDAKLNKPGLQALAAEHQV